MKEAVVAAVTEAVAGCEGERAAATAAWEVLVATVVAAEVVWTGAAMGWGKHISRNSSHNSNHLERSTCLFLCR